MAELNARIIAKASATAGEEPVAGDLEVAELAVNTADGKLFTKHTDNSIVTISGGTGGGATSIDDLTDVDTSTTAPTDGQVLTWVDLDARWKPAQLPDTTTTWQLTANGSTDYIFTGPGLDGVNDPTIYLMRGQTYKFVNETGAHPFKIQQVGGAAYSSGITNNEVSNGTLTFEVPMEAPSILEYVCTSHAAMTGTIHILAEDSISLATLKTEVAASTDFTDFQSRIAAL